MSGQNRLQEVLGEKTGKSLSNCHCSSCFRAVILTRRPALEDLVKSLRTSLSRLTIELEQHKAIVAELRHAQAQPQTPASPPKSQVTNELIALRREVERLSGEVHRLGGIVEQGLETRKKSRGEETIRMMDHEGVGDLITLSDEEVQRVQKDVERRSTKSAPTRTHQHQQAPEQQPSKLRQGTHRAGSPDPILIDPSIHIQSQTPKPNYTKSRPTQSRVSSHSSDSENSSNRTRSKPTHTHPQDDGPSSPFPSIREEDEIEFFDVSRRATVASSPDPTTDGDARRGVPDDIARVLEMGGGGEIPAQTVLARVIGELESDFKHYKS